jgi:D-glycero-D-manno-heptose 1,7-bisphosphate phosphatase
MSNSYIIFDRDGTLIQDIPYLIDPEKVEILPKAIDGLLLFKFLRFKFGIITNQSAVGRGYADEHLINLVNERVLSFFLAFDIKFDFVLFCPHKPIDNCQCRKPMSKLGQIAINEFGIDPTTSYVIGDKDSDIQFGKRIGFKTIRLRSSYPTEEIADFSACNMLECANWVYLNHEQKN